LRVHIHLAHHLLEKLEHDAIERGVLQTTFSSFRQRRTDGEGDHDVIGVLLGAVTEFSIRLLHTCDVGGEGLTSCRWASVRASVARRGWRDAEWPWFRDDVCRLKGRI
jgi:hypothetical protein